LERRNVLNSESFALNYFTVDYLMLLCSRFSG